MVTKQIDKTTLHLVPQAWIVCCCEALFFCFQFMQIDIFSAIGKSFLKNFAINATYLASLSAIYLYAMAAFSLVAGVLLDKYSIKNLILNALFLTVLALIFIAFTKNILIIYLLRFFMGICGSLSFISSIKLASRWFSVEKLGLVSGMVTSIGLFGGMVAQTPMACISNILNWRYAVLVNAMIGIIIWLIIFYFVKDNPRHSIVKHKKEKTSFIGLKNYFYNIKNVATNIYNWKCALYTCFLNLPILVLGPVWGEPYLEKKFLITPFEAANSISMLFLGTLLGSPFIGAISDLFRSRQFVMLIGAISSLLIIILIIYLPAMSIMGLMILFFLLGFSTSTQAISYPLVTQANDESLTATALGFASVIIMSGGGIVQYVFGWILDKHWHEIILKNNHFYSIQDYNHAILLIPFFFMISLILAINFYISSKSSISKFSCGNTT